MQKQALGKGLGALIPDLSALDDKEKKALGISRDRAGQDRAERIPAAEGL